MAYGIVVRVDRCIGCFNCAYACKDEHVENDFPPYAAAQPDLGQLWMSIEETEGGTYPWVRTDYVPLPCQHCDAQGYQTPPPPLVGRVAGKTKPPPGREARRLNKPLTDAEKASLAKKK